MLALAAAVAVAGCGGGATGGGHAAADAFAWLRPAQPPTGWQIARLPSGAAALAYPPAWRPIRTDPGTVSAALLGSHGRIRGYLNATPQSGTETLANWSHFRPAHNHEEGDRGIVTEAAATRLRFRSGERLVRRRSLRDRVGSLPRDRVHRARLARHDGRGGCRPAARLGPARADIAAFDRELLDLTGTAIGQRVAGFGRARRRR